MKPHLLLARNVALSNFRRLDFPYKLTLVTTYACNYRCQTCNIWERRPTGELTLDEIRRFFQQSPGFNWIDFTGGEPWLRRDFPDIVAAAVTHCPGLLIVHFPTNGYLTTQIVAGVKRIMQTPPPRLIITVSVDGNEAVNDGIRGIAGGWARQIDTYRQLREIPGVEVVLGMTISSLNAGKYAEAFEAVRAVCPWLTARDFHMNLVHESSHYYGNGGARRLRDGAEPVILEEFAAYRRARGFPRSIGDVLERQYLKSVAAYVRTGATPMRCHALRASCFVDSWGNVYPCSMYDAKIANLRDHDYNLATIWRLAEARRLQQEIWESKCPQCWTPCEAYQSIVGNFLGLRPTPEANAR